MSSSRLKKVLLILGIVLAVLIGMNAYGSTKVLIKDTETGIMPSVDKLKRLADPKVLVDMIKK